VALTGNTTFVTILSTVLLALKSSSAEDAKRKQPAGKREGRKDRNGLALKRGKRQHKNTVKKTEN
jgi:hypothetical protein